MEGFDAVFVDFGGSNNLQMGKSWVILGQRQRGKRDSGLLKSYIGEI